MAELDDQDKRNLLGPNYKEIERQEARETVGSHKTKSAVVVAVFVVLASAILIANVGVELNI